MNAERRLTQPEQRACGTERGHQGLSKRAQVEQVRLSWAKQDIASRTLD